MKQSNTSKYAYTAAFIDGEGCIYIPVRIRKDRQSPSYTLRVSVSQKDGKVIDWLRGNCGGFIHQRKDGIYSWIIQERKAYELLKKIRPFMKVKERQADLAIRLYDKYTRKEPINTNGQNARLTEHEIKQKQKIKEEIMELNHVYRKSKVYEEKLRVQRLSEITLH